MAEQLTTPMQTTPNTIAAKFGCTTQQAQAQYRRNASAMRQIAEQAVKAGKAVRGKTAVEWLKLVDKFEAIANG